MPGRKIKVNLIKTPLFFFKVLHTGNTQTDVGLQLTIVGHMTIFFNLPAGECLCWETPGPVLGSPTSSELNSVQH